MPNINFQNSKAYSIVEFDNIIQDIVNSISTEFYPEKMHSFILHNYELAESIQKNLAINKKLFNAVQKSQISNFGLITEPWCLDACIILPLLRAIEVINPTIHISIYPRDTNEVIINQFLTNGSQSIPIIVGINKDGNEAFRWGPRSSKAIGVIDPILKEEYSVKQKALTDFYLQDATQDIQEEWIKIF